MSSIFDRLQDELDDRNDGSGISPMDLLDLPDNLRRIMTRLLRAVTMTHADAHKMVASWPEKDRLSPKDLDKAFDSLLKQGWLINIGEGELRGYRVNLRRKKGSTLAANIWGALDEKITTRKRPNIRPESHLKKDKPEEPKEDEEK